MPLWEPHVLHIKAYRFCGPSPRTISAKRSNIVRSFESTGLGRANPKEFKNNLQLSIYIIYMY